MISRLFSHSLLEALFLTTSQVYVLLLLRTAALLLLYLTQSNTQLPTCYLTTHCEFSYYHVRQCTFDHWIRNEPHRTCEPIETNKNCPVAWFSLECQLYGLFSLFILFQLKKCTVTLHRRDSPLFITRVFSNDIWYNTTCGTNFGGEKDNNMAGERKKYVDKEL